MTQVLLMALGCTLVVEGLFYALVPGHLKRMLENLNRLPDDGLRIAGVVAVALGVLWVFVVQQLFSGV